MFGLVIRFLIVVSLVSFSMETLAGLGGRYERDIGNCGGGDGRNIYD